MRDNIPNNVFLSESIQKRIAEIVAFRDSLVEKNSKLFEDKKEFIALHFQMSPQKDGTDPILKFEPKYSPNIPESIKKGLNTFLSQFI